MRLAKLPASILLTLTIAAGVLLAPEPAAATGEDLAEESELLYQESLGAVADVDRLIEGGVDDIDVLDAQAKFFRERHVTSLGVRDEVLACGEDCRASLPVIEAAVLNFGSSLGELQDHSLKAYDFYVDWCCASASETLGSGCTQMTSIWHICDGICWTCNAGWTNEDGTIGCEDGHDVECPKG